MSFESSRPQKLFTFNDEVDFSKIIFEKKEKAGSKTNISFNAYYINENKEKCDICIQTPTLTVPFGRSSQKEYEKAIAIKEGKPYIDDVTKIDRYTLNFSLKYENETEPIFKFRTLIGKFNDFVIDQLSTDIEKFHGKVGAKKFTGKSKESIVSSIIDSCYEHGMVKSPNEKDADKNYGDRFKVKLPVFKDKTNPDNSVPFFKVVNKENKPIPTTFVNEKGSTDIDWGWSSKYMMTKCIIKFDGLKAILQGDKYKFFASWSANIVKVMPQNQSSKKVEFIDDGEKIDDTQVSEEYGGYGEEHKTVASKDIKEVDIKVKKIVIKEEDLKNKEENEEDLNNSDKEEKEEDEYVEEDHE